MKRLILLIFFLSFFFSTQSFANPESIEITNRIIFLERQLKSPRYRERLNACRILESLPPVATDVLVKRFPKLTDSRSKSLIIQVLTNRKYDRIEELIIEQLPNLTEYKELFLEILLRNPEKTFHAFRYQLFENEKRPDRQPILESLYQQFVKKAVLQIFENYFKKVYKSPRYGFYQKDFDQIKIYGNEGISILLKIINYSDDIKDDLNFYSNSYIRTIAIRVLASQTHHKLITLIKETKIEFFISSLAAEKQIALYLLDQDTAILETIRSKKINAIQGSSINWKILNWVEAVVFYNRINKFEEAEEVFDLVHKYILEKVDLEDAAFLQECLYALYLNAAEVFTEKGEFDKVQLNLDYLLNYFNDADVWEFILNNRNFENFWNSDTFNDWIEVKRKANPDIVPKESPGYLFQE